MSGKGGLRLEGNTGTRAESGKKKAVVLPEGSVGREGDAEAGC